MRQGGGARSDKMALASAADTGAVCVDDSRAGVMGDNGGSMSVWLREWIDREAGYCPTGRAMVSVTTPNG